MGTIGNSGRLGAFQSGVFASGLDAGRGEIRHAPGYFKAAENATILQGQMVALNANQELVLATSNDVFGIAKFNKAPLGKSLTVDAPHVVAFNTAVPLARGNVSNVVVRTVVNGAAGTVIPATDNFTLSAANGTVTWDAAPTGTNAPANGATVYVTYTYDLTLTDYRFQGLNFFNMFDDTFTTEGRLTVITGPAMVFTTQYDTAQTYAVNDSLFCGGSTPALAGLFTNQAAQGRYVGKVIQPPRADDPYMGIRFTGHPEEE